MSFLAFLPYSSFFYYPLIPYKINFPFPIPGLSGQPGDPLATPPAFSPSTACGYLVLQFIPIFKRQNPNKFDCTSNWLLLAIHESGQPPFYKLE